MTVTDRVIVRCELSGRAVRIRPCCQLVQHASGKLAKADVRVAALLADDEPPPPSSPGTA
jgi:hypothetical protein